MLTEIKLTNFKCFKEETSIPLSRFNLFTGVNGSGKSTALQALLLMRQSFGHHKDNIAEIFLNGSCINLGGFDDIHNHITSIKEPIIFEIITTTIREKIFTKYYLTPSKDNMLLLIYKIYTNDYCIAEGEACYLEYNDKSGEYCNKNKKLEIYHFDGNLDEIHFISADRIGPQEFYQKSNLPNFIHVGKNGEFAVNLLNTIGQQLVNETLCLGNDAKTLLTQTEAWLGKILNPLSLETKPLGKSNFLELLIGGFKPSNVGFGYSCILPIIVTGLIAQPGEKIIIENPEIHLHPKAQSALIEFLIKVANTGVQVFIESHSDHIINGVLVQCKKYEESQSTGISKEDVTINYFYKDEENKSIITKIDIEEGGRIFYTPKEFFDQFTIDRKFLMGF